MKRWLTVNPFDGSETFDYTLPKKVWDESIVDKSHFIPVAEALKNLEGNSAAMHADLTRFDFPDGKDNGMVLPPSRLDRTRLFQIPCGWLRFLGYCNGMGLSHGKRVGKDSASPPALR